MMDYNEELIIDFLLNYEWATSRAITEKLNIKRPVVTGCLTKLKKNKLVESTNQELLDGRIEKFWRITKEVRDYLTSD